MLARILNSIFFLLLSSSLNATTVQGTYEKGSLESGGPWGIIYFHSVSPVVSFFYLEWCKGEPSYNNGSIYGRLSTRNLKTLTFEFVPSYTISFTFDPDMKSLQISEVKGSWGSSWPDGTYNRKSRTCPTYFGNRCGKKIYFEETKPEDYNDC